MPYQYLPFRPQSDVAPPDTETRSERERINALIADAQAGNLAIWRLADETLPPDLAEAATRWRLETTMQAIWRQAFSAGWRAALHTKETPLENHRTA